MEQLKSIKKELGMERDDKTALAQKFTEKFAPFKVRETTLVKSVHTFHNVQQAPVRAFYLSPATVQKPRVQLRAGRIMHTHAPQSSASFYVDHNEC